MENSNQQEIKKNLIDNQKETPTKDEWLEIFDQKIKTNIPSLEKVVLSRIKTITFNERPSDFLILNNLKKENNAYAFYLKKSQFSSIFSISPETLYKRNNDLIEIDAIAGTRSYNNPNELKSKTLI